MAYLDDPHGIVHLALEDAGDTLRGQAVTATRTGSVLDTISAARALKALDCCLVITLGGDGTNRAVALGWQDIPVLPISTGTNNVFPIFVEATIAGATAGLIASGQVALAEVAHQHKVIRVRIDGDKDGVLTSAPLHGKSLLDRVYLEDAVLHSHVDHLALTAEQGDHSHFAQIHLDRVGHRPVIAGIQVLADGLAHPQ